jgi:hypothetical protein
LNQIPYADVTALITDEQCKLQRLVTEFMIESERMKLSANVAKSKVMRVTKRENVGDIDITLNVIRMEEGDGFRYFGVHIHRDGGMES